VLANAVVGTPTAAPGTGALFQFHLRVSAALVNSSRTRFPLGGTGSTLSPVPLLLPERHWCGSFVANADPNIESPVRGGIAFLRGNERLTAKPSPNLFHPPMTPMHADEKPEKICTICVIGGFVFRRLPATRRAGFYGPS